MNYKRISFRLPVQSVLFLMMFASFPLLGLNCGTTEESSSSSGGSSDLEVSFKNVAGPMTPGVFGIHVQGLYSRSAMNKKKLVLETAEGRALLDGLEFHGARFPAGSGSWGYRLYENDGKTYARGLGYYVSGQKDRYKNNTQNAIFDFFDFCEYMGIDEVTYVMNFKQPIEEGVDVIKLMEDKGLKVVQVELGNEYHLKGHEAGKGEAVYRTAMADASDYTNWCDRVVSGFRNGGYTGNFSIICANSVAMDGVSRRPSSGIKAFYWDWNEEVGRWARKNNQGIITHQYLYHGMTLKKDNLSWSQRERKIVGYLNRDGQDYIDKYVTGYYGPITGSGINITEWGVKNSGEAFGNTMLEGLHVTRFLLDMNRRNTTGGTRIESAFFQKITGQPTTALITPVVDPGATIDGSKAYKGETDYYAFKTFKGLVHGSTLWNLNLNGPATSLVRSNSLVVEGIEDADGNRWLICVNSGPDEVRLNVTGPNTGFYGKSLMSGNGFNLRNWDGENYKRPAVDRANLENIAVYEEVSNLIRPFSVCRIKVE